MITQYLHDAETAEMLSMFQIRRHGRIRQDGARHVDPERKVCLTIVHEGEHAKAAFMAYAAQRPRAPVAPIFGKPAPFTFGC